MSRVLIIGIDSVIGQALGEALTARGDTVFGTTRRAATVDGKRRLWLDLEMIEVPQTALPAADIAVFCAAKARYAECRLDPVIARGINVEATVGLARRLVDQGSRVLLLSTSAVFDGSRPHRRAEEPTGAASLYGSLKAEAEAGCLALGTAAAIFRLTKLVTPLMPLFTGWMSALAGGRNIRAFTDLRFCPLSIGHVVTALLAAIDDRGGAIYQVSGAEDIAYLDAARHLAQRLDADPNLVDAARAVDHGIPPEEILHHTTLDTGRLSMLTGFRPPSPTAVLDAIVPALATPPSGTRAEPTGDTHQRAAPSW
jgi:dTDP-4-dehydrorhamnose reductase